MVWHSCSLVTNELLRGWCDGYNVQSLPGDLQSIMYIPCTQFPKEKHVYGECILVHVFQAKVELSNLRRLNIIEGARNVTYGFFLYCSWNGYNCGDDFLKIFIYYLFIYLWLCWVFVAVRWLSLVAVSRVSSLVAVHGFPLLRNTTFRRVGFSSCSVQAQ